MDPLTIATGVITLLQATTTLISVCYDFRAALKNEPWSLTNIIHELKSLRIIIESLEENSHGRGSPKDRNKSDRSADEQPDATGGALAICHQEGAFLDKQIRGSSYSAAKRSTRNAFLQALRWQLRERDVEECIGRIERCKTLLSLALHEDQR
jgi:hypothetical protein